MAKTIEKKHIKCVQKCNKSYSASLNKKRASQNKKASRNSLKGGKRHSKNKSRKSRKSRNSRKKSLNKRKSRRSRKSRKQKGSGYSIWPNESIAGRPLVRRYSDCK